MIIKSLFKKSRYAISALILSSCIANTAFAWMPVIPLTVGVHAQNIGDIIGHQGRWVGTIGESRRIELINISNPGGPANLYGGRILYKCHIEGTGDTDWMSAGQDCGTRMQGRRLEGIEIKIVANDYPVPIRLACHVQNVGFMEMSTNNSVYCGTTGRGLRLEAINLTIGGN